MTNRTDLARRFLDLHRKGEPLLLANAWDAGSARVFASLGFEALATTSSGHAGTLGRRDGRIGLDEVLAHCAEMAGATPLPVSADLENCFAATAAGVADAVRRAAATGLAGCSIEDFARDEKRIYPIDEARERVAAAVSAAHAEGSLVLTARCENHIRGVFDLKDTIARLQAYQDAGADVLYAPGLADLSEIEQLVSSVDRPVNVLCRPGGPNVAQLASAGVARISVGGAFYYVGVAAIAEAAREWKEHGTHDFWAKAAPGIELAHEVFGD